MHKTTFFNVNNGNCFLIELENSQLILFDFANPGNSKSSNLTIDTVAEIKAILKRKGRNYLDVVAFTHLDSDHIGKASEHFYFDHVTKYQSDERIKINSLWVPAGAILESDAVDEASIVRREACYRLKQGKGIRVFSRPQKLEQWLNNQKPSIALDERKHLICDAGKPVPGFDKAVNGVEFFVHSPFAHRQDDNELIDRNTNCIVVQATFLCRNKETKALLMGDMTWEGLDALIGITRFHENEQFLEWDVYALPHHCSYLSLNSEKGVSITKPTENIKWLLEVQSQHKAIIVSSSKIIPTIDTTQPPHRQAANYYRSCAQKADGKFLVTMEQPSPKEPKPLVIRIDEFGATVEKRINSYAAPAIATKSTPRAG